jgi:hypothetical protein
MFALTSDNFGRTDTQINAAFYLLIGGMVGGAIVAIAVALAMMAVK